MERETEREDYYVNDNFDNTTKKIQNYKEFHHLKKIGGYI